MIGRAAKGGSDTPESVIAGCITAIFKPPESRKYSYYASLKRITGLIKWAILR